MNLRRKHKETAEVSTESLNDIMFFLLLFFLIVSTLVNPNVIKLTLPSSKHNTTINKPKVVVEVSKDRQYAINGITIPLSALEEAISAEVNRTKENSVVLRLDNSLSIQDLVDVLQIGDKLGIKMVLKTKSPSVN